ncbi:uncharacterized protein LOC117110295 [Anneissia japonica]|uniref:uncharacterized protein LOC117110295 n=1 Tax=Anneissia japonica TaxID=1529436 RepID=UPI0014257330|nr:uncharacterized protein LOC117110295 [Anneissia japonica]
MRAVLFCVLAACILIVNSTDDEIYSLLEKILEKAADPCTIPYKVLVDCKGNSGDCSKLKDVGARRLQICADCLQSKKLTVNKCRPVCGKCPVQETCDRCLGSPVVEDALVRCLNAGGACASS